jgi:dTDP-4-dehydrorhamnose reductase
MISSDIIKKRILIIGSNGMLGQSLTEFYLTRPDIELLCTSVEAKSFIPSVTYSQLEITQKNQVKDIILNFFPDYIINTAAYTQVDKAESERELAWKVNVGGVDNIALYAWTIDAHLIHMSSDYIFDGKGGPYTENDKPNPIGYYGRTKLASENSLRSNGARFTIVRSNVLYGHTQNSRPDFVRWVISSLKGQKEIRIVTDQFNNPTFLDDITIAINSIIEFKKEGIYNIGGREFLSRYDFALAIADFFGLDKNLIKPILTRDLNQPAPRPLKSGLINLKAETELDYKPSTMNEAFQILKESLKL